MAVRPEDAREGSSTPRAWPELAIARDVYAASPTISCKREVRFMGNPFVHVELMSTDVGKAKAFYGKKALYGKLEDMDIGDMTYESEHQE
jgi:hypothetical protein